MCNFLKPCSSSRLRVIPVAGSNLHARLIDAHLDVVILVGMLWWRGLLRHLVPCTGVCEILCQVARDIAVAGGHDPATLGGEHLQAKVGDLRVRGLADTLSERSGSSPVANLVVNPVQAD